MAYSAFLDGGFGGELYSIATKRDQAMIVFDALKAMISADEELSAMCKIQKHHLTIPETSTTISALPSTPESLDGLNPSLIVCDEIAAWQGEKGKKTYKVLKSAAGARPEPLIINITTAGYEREGIFDQILQYPAKSNPRMARL